MDTKRALETLEGGYDPSQIEDNWYQYWTDKGYFHADENDDTKEAFSIVIPPPNVTGQLHMGHVLFVTLQDLLIRWKKMCGYNTLWLPGTDHAGIATQMVVERELANTEGVSRHDIGREEFLKRVWKWKAEKGGRITQQLRVLGAALDWERERFTMDEGLSKAVREVFVRLHEEGLIYRADRLINWCPRCHTALSDLEVEHKDNLPGELWSFAYPLADGDGELVVATTRPETMLGDSAVAVHPEDDRYKHLIGRELRHPLLGYTFPIVGDDILVDPEFGTGAVKVTPAHDPNDFEVGLRHNLKFINILDIDGVVNENGGKYKGLDRFEARRVIKEDLAALGLERGREDHTMSIGHCQRCETVVEPYMSKQWYVKIQPLADEAIKAVEDGRTVFIPKQWEKTYFEWMYNIRDWCISRQLWWGHQIPAWYCNDCDEVMVLREEPTTCTKCGSKNIRRDEDVLDTWFSSALWPFSTLGWPDETKMLTTYYPTTVMETGFDIIFFWVARMMMMGLHFMDEVPFKTIYLHAMVRDHDGDKMSKVKGNVIDPLDVISGIGLDDLLVKRERDARGVGIEDKGVKRILKATKKMFPQGIPTAGADALRFTFTAMAGQGRDVRLDVKRIEGYRFFCNKIWNATRYALMNLQDFEPVERMDAEALTKLELSLADRWILTRISETAADMERALDAFGFDEAGRVIYGFFWGELCDWYIELVKTSLQSDDPTKRRNSQIVLVHALDASLRMLHPIMPFVTEHLWQLLPLTRPVESIMVDSYPRKDAALEDIASRERMEFVMDVIRAVRTIRGESRIEPKVILPQVVVQTQNEDRINDLKKYSYYVSVLCKVEGVEASTDYERSGPVATGVLSGGEVFVPLAGVIDVDDEKARLARDAEKVEKELQRSEGKLNNERFVSRAPAEIVEKEKEIARDAKERLENIRRSLDLLG